MLSNVLEQFSGLPRSNRWLVYFENPGQAGFSPTLGKNLGFFAQSVAIPGRTIMTKETFNLTQPQSYGYASQVGEMQMTFLVSNGSQGKSTYEMFYGWMDKIVSMAFGNISYSDSHVLNARLKVIDQGAVKDWSYWNDGGNNSGKNDEDHIAFYATRMWPSALGNLSLGMEEGILTFDTTFKIHKLLEFNTASPSAQNRSFNAVATSLASLKNKPTGELQAALNQSNDIGRIAVDAFDKISKAAVKEGEKAGP